MPDFPPTRGQRNQSDYQRYDSKGDLTTRQPEAFVSKDTSGEVTQAYGKVGEVVSENTLKWSNAYDTIQKTVAQADFKAGMADILNRAANDPNSNNSDQYFKEIEKLKGESLKGFSSKYAETQMAVDLGYEAKVGSVQVQNLYKKKAIDVGQAKTLQLLDMTVQNPSADLEERIGGILKPQVDAGVIGQKDAYELQKKYVKEGKYNSFLIDLNSDPGTAAEKLSKNEYGLDSKDLAKAKKYQGNMTKKVEEARKMQQLQTVTDFSDKLVNQKLTPEEVQNAVASGMMDAETGLAFELATAGPDKWREGLKSSISVKEVRTRTEAFLSPLRDLDKTTPESRQIVVKSALQNYNDKKLNLDELSFILRAANGQTTDPKNPIWGYLKSAVNSVAKSPVPTKAGYGIMEKFRSRWDFKEDPRETMKTAAIDQFKEDRPETASMKMGDVIKRKSGSYEIVGFNENGSPVFRKK